MKFKILAVAAATAVMPHAAHAQAYVQAELGLDSVSLETDLGDGVTYETSQEGLAYGASVGYDFPINEKLYAGIEATVFDSTTKYCERDIDVIGDRACIRSGRDLAATVHIGTMVSEQASIYALGGYTNARIRATYEDGVGTLSAGENGDGVRLGAGYKMNFGTDLFIKLEYRYSNYQDGFSRHNGIIAAGINF